MIFVNCQSITVHPISLVIKSNFPFDLIHIDA